MTTTLAAPPVVAFPEQSGEITMSFPALFAGKARFTVVLGPRERYTYWVQQGTNGPFFAKVMVGSDNEMSYTYLGILDRTRGLRHTQNSGFEESSKPFRVLQRVFGVLSSGRSIPTECSILNAGTCCRCGRTLTDPESIRSGVGPECRKKL